MGHIKTCFENTDNTSRLEEKIYRLETKVDDLAEMVRAVVNAQGSLSGEIHQVEATPNKRMDALRQKNNGFEQRVTTRIDLLGKELAVLDDDAVHREDFDELEGTGLANLTGCMGKSLEQEGESAKLVE